MRLRTLVAAVAAALLVPVLAAPASAGTGTANWCGDNITGPGGRDVPILSGPITVGVEIYNSPTNTNMQQVRVCFSDTAPGVPSRITGGEVAVGVWLDSGTVTPGGYVRLECIPDVGPTGTWPICNNPVGASVYTGDVGLVQPGFCLVTFGAGCAAYLPGVYTNRNAPPLLSINLLGFPVAVDVPVRCIVVGATSCP